MLRAPADETSQVQQAVADLDGKFAALSKSIDQLGTSITQAEIAAAHQAVLGKLSATINDIFCAQYLELTDPYQAAVDAETKLHESQLRDVKAAHGDLELEYRRTRPARRRCSASTLGTWRPGWPSSSWARVRACRRRRCWPRRSGSLPPPSMPQVKAAATARLDAEAENARARYITLGSGQALVYLAKAAEADAIVDDPHPAAERYPLLAAEVGITVPASGDTAADLHAVGAAIRTVRAGWVPVAAQIERLHLGAKQRVEQAEHVADVEAVFPIPWP